MIGIVFTFTVSLFWHFSGDCDSDLAVLDCKPTDPTTSLHLSTKKQKAIDSALLSQDENESIYWGAGLGFLLGTHAFKPIYLPTRWKNPQTKTKWFLLLLFYGRELATGSGTCLSKILDEFRSLWYSGTWQCST